MKTCPRCDAENPDEAHFCNLCYASFEAQAETTVNQTEIKAEKSGASARCPNCGEVGPLNAEFCGRCGFEFSGTARQVVEPEKRASEAQARLDALEKEAREIREKPMVIAADTDGAELMRRLAESLDAGFRPRVRASGKEPIALIIKLLARLGEEMRSKDKQLWVQPYFVDGEPVRYLEDMEVELVVVASARAG